MEHDHLVGLDQDVSDPRRCHGRRDDHADRAPHPRRPARDPHRRSRGDPVVHEQAVRPVRSKRLPGGPEAPDTLVQRLPLPPLHLAHLLLGRALEGDQRLVQHFVPPSPIAPMASSAGTGSRACAPRPRRAVRPARGRPRTRPAHRRAAVRARRAPAPRRCRTSGTSRRPASVRSANRGEARDHMLVLRAASGRTAGTSTPSRSGRPAIRAVRVSW